MSVGFLLAVVVVFALLVGCEWWWRTHEMQGEWSRKFVHLTVGTFVAFWPFFLSWNEIRFLSLAFALVVAVSKYFHIFKSIHSVKRPTWGEVLFAISVGALTFITQNKWIYAASLLQMSLADGLAAVVGLQAAKSRRYEVWGHTKSINGTVTFFLVSTLILLWYRDYAVAMPILETGLIAVGATILENIGIAGLDNVLVPVFIALVLSL